MLLLRVLNERKALKLYYATSVTPCRLLLFFVCVSTPVAASALRVCVCAGVRLRSCVRVCRCATPRCLFVVYAQTVWAARLRGGVGGRRCAVVDSAGEGRREGRRELVVVGGARGEALAQR